MKKIAIILAMTVGVTAALVLPSSVASESPEVKSDNKAKITEHFNMMIVPDLSNRIDTEMRPKPVSDQRIIQSILGNIQDGFLKSQGRRTNQKDRFQLLFTNQTLITKHRINTEDLLLDFSQFDKQKHRIDYIKGRGDNGSFNVDLSKMDNEVGELYKSAKQDIGGADIWSFMKNLNSSKIKVPGSIQTSRTMDGEEYKNEYRNILILLTDGYIEAGRYSNKKLCPSLSQNRMSQFRKSFIRNGNDRTIEQFFTDEGYGITPIMNPLLKEIEIIVMELDDRSVNQNGNATEDISDMDIIKLFWSDWLTKSGVKKYELYSKAASESEVDNNIKDFIFLN
jgi:hypothetical protein